MRENPKLIRQKPAIRLWEGVSQVSLSCEKGDGDVGFLFGYKHFLDRFRHSFFRRWVLRLLRFDWWSLRICPIVFVFFRLCSISSNTCDNSSNFRNRCSCVRRTNLSGNSGGRRRIFSLHAHINILSLHADTCIFVHREPAFLLWGRGALWNLRRIRWFIDFGRRLHDVRNRLYILLHDVMSWSHVHGSLMRRIDVHLRVVMRRKSTVVAQLLIWRKAVVSGCMEGIVRVRSISKQWNRRVRVQWLTIIFASVTVHL
mmetsp:Transcript_11354/g.27381  ORF Transcript_11354/g.27381 Transcript_11354/m.27381 type:complete len:257 (+) Transcript_11354:597-1367(+)